MLNQLETLANHYSIAVDAVSAMYFAIRSEACNELCNHYFDETDRYRELHVEEMKLEKLRDNLLGGWQALNAASYKISETKRMIDWYEFQRRLSA